MEKKKKRSGEHRDPKGKGELSALIKPEVPVLIRLQQNTGFHSKFLASSAKVGPEKERVPFHKTSTGNRIIYPQPIASEENKPYKILTIKETGAFRTLFCCCAVWGQGFTMQFNPPETCYVVQAGSSLNPPASASG